METSLEEEPELGGRREYFIITTTTATTTTTNIRTLFGLYISCSGSRICVKTEREEKPCHVNKCPQDCQFKPWSEWTACSRTCGTGIQTRTRAIDRYQEYGGKPCKGERAEKRSCNGGDCAADGEWSQWGAWGYCQATCGEGIKKRMRECDDPKPENGGKDCLGVKEEVEKCQIKKCDVIDGNWSAWSRWGGCSRKCGAGHITRRRTCTNPKPENGGDECQGESEEKRKCYLKGCYDKTTTASTTTTTAATTTPEPTTTTTVKTVQEPRVSQGPLEESCLFPAPRVIGYSGPYDTVDSDTEDDGLTVKVGDYAFYKCHSGKVSNLRTNSRLAALECMPNRTFSTTNLPTCQRPQFCVGALPLRQDGLGKVMGIPSRDQKVNSHISVMCPRDSRGKLLQLTAYGSCFSDGIIRYPNIPPCKNPKFAPTSNLNSINRGMVTRSCSYEKMVEVTLNSVDDYGWLEYSNVKNVNEKDQTITDLISNSKDVGSNPFNVVSSVFETFLTMTPKNGSDLILPQISSSTTHNGSTRCRYLLRAPNGYALRLGVEWLPRSVRLTDALAGEELSLFDAFNSGRGSVTSEGGVVAVEARMRPGEKVRMNYQVVAA